MPPPGGPVPVTASLTDLVLRLADDPSRANRAAFCTAFVKSRVGTRVPTELGPSPIRPGKYVTVRPSRMPALIGKAPDGSPIIVVLPDIPEWVKREPARWFAELAAADIIRIAIANHAAIAVQATKDGREAWALIPKEEVLHLNRQA
jgi:hypothetical protein